MPMRHEDDVGSLHYLDHSVEITKKHIVRYNFP